MHPTTKPSSPPSPGAASRRTGAALAAAICVSVAGPAAAATGSSAGYSFVDDASTGGPAYNWLTVSTVATGADNCDDCSHAVALPFPFTFYGTAVSNAWIGSNGYLTFDSPDTAYSNQPLSSASAEHAAVHAWWDDWDARAATSHVYYGTVGAAPNRIFVVTWDSIQHFTYSSNPDSVSFQIQLFEGTNSVELHYRDTDSTGTSNDHGLSGTIGLDNGAGSAPFLQYSSGAATLAAGRAIRFDVNQAPTAVAAGPLSGSEGTAVALDGSSSSDPDGSVVNYEWDCTDNGSYDFSSTSSAGGCLYGDDGQYTVRLRVTDDDGATATTTTTVTVSNVAPTAVLTSPGSGAEGLALPFGGAASDPGVADTHTFAWSFGDGMTSTLQNPTHAYADEGTGSYLVTLTVTDDDGASSSASAVVNVANQAPNPGLGLPGSALEGQALAFTSTPVDPGVQDTHTFAWSFGDGTTSTLQNPTHTYADEGAYSVTLTVTDDDGGVGTTTSTLAVANAAPTPNLSAPASGLEGQSLAFASAPTDPGAGDTHTYLWSFGDGTTSTLQNPTHAYADEGTGAYAVTLTVTDNDGGAATETATVALSNVAPTAQMTAPPNGIEGQSLSFSATATDPGTADTHTYLWSFGDGATSTLQNPTHTYADQGTGAYTVTLTVTDDDGGSDSAVSAIAVANAAPTIDSLTGATAGLEGQTLSWTALASDAGSQDTVTLSWAFGDGATATGSSVSHAYADDSAYTLTLTATDSDGASTTSTLPVVVSNAAPTVTSTSGPATGDEGEALSFSAVVTDAGSVDAAALTVSWDFGDGTPAQSGLAPTHAFDDEGTGPYTVTVTVTDPQGATGNATLTVGIDNVAPTLTSAAPTTAVEGTLYSYAAAATDPGADTLGWTLSSAPAGAVVSASGVVSWTPTYEQAGARAFGLTVDDGDGGSAHESWTVAVTFIDADNDGMADTWETANGLDPSVDDSAGDPDGDGVSNLDEFQLGQDPNVDDGPPAPVLTSPIAGEEVATAQPELVWEPSVDANGDPVTYVVEVYADAGMAVLLTSAGGLTDPAWTLDVPAPENADAHWRVAADDGWTTGVFSDLEAVFVNEVDEAPGVPTALYPVGGEQVNSLTPTLRWVEADDVDRDVVDHEVRIWDAAGENVLAEGLVLAEERDVAWPVDITLEEDGSYQWDIRAIDEHGMEGDWSALEPFFATAENAPPTPVEFTSPQDGDALESRSPVFTATESVDPEGHILTYELALDTDPGFASEDLVQVVLPHTGAGEVTWDLGADGVELTENVVWHARVRAADEDGGSSPWFTIEVFVRGDNDAPHAPVLLSPEDGASLEPGLPVLAAAHAVDPEGDAVTYEFRVSRDLGGADVVAQSEAIEPGAGPEGTADQASWAMEGAPSGELFWTARAIDDRGAASEWAEPWAVTLEDSDDDGGPGDEQPGCDCSASVAQSSGSSAMFLALLLPLVARRTRRR